MGGFYADNNGRKEWWEQLYLGLLWLIVFGAYFVTIGLYLKRRHTPSIANRLPGTVLASMWFLGGTLGVSQVGELFDPFFGCRHAALNVLRAYGGWCFFALMACGVWRLLQLIAKFEHQRIRLDGQLRSEGHDLPSDGSVGLAATTPAPMPPVPAANGVVSLTTATTALPVYTNFWQRNLHVITSTPLAIILFIYTIIPPVWLLYMEPAEYDDMCQSDGRGTTGLVVPIFLLPLMILIVALAWKVRTIEEGFQIVRELKFQGLVGLFHGAAIILWGMYPRGQRSPAMTIQAMISTILLWIVTFVQPLQRSYYYEALNKHLANSPLAAAKACELDVPPEIGTFAGLLASRPGILSFGQFLATEFSVENLYFVQAVEMLQRWKPTHLPPPVAEDDADAAYEAQCIAEARAKAMEVYTKFIGRNAPFEVNLSHTIAKKLHREFRVRPAKTTAAAAATAALQPPTITSRPNSRAGAPQPPGGGLLAPPVLDTKVAGTDVSPSLAASTAPPTAGGAGAAGLLPTAVTTVISAERPVSAGAAHSTDADRVAENLLRRVGSGPTLQALPEELAVKLRAQPAFGASPLPAPAKDQNAKSTDVSSVHGLVGAGGVPSKRPRTVAYYLSIFDEAHAAVSHLLESDSYSRYIASTAFERLVKSLTLAKKLAATSNDRSRDAHDPVKSHSNDGAGEAVTAAANKTGQMVITVKRPSPNPTGDGGAAYVVADPPPPLRTSSLFGRAGTITANNNPSPTAARGSGTETAATPVLTHHLSLTLSPSACTPTNSTPKNAAGESLPLLLPTSGEGSGGAGSSSAGASALPAIPASNKPKRTVTKIVARTGSALTVSGVLESSLTMSAAGALGGPRASALPTQLELSVSVKPT